MTERSSSKRHDMGVCVNAGDIGETCRTRGRHYRQNKRSLQKAVSSSLRYCTSEKKSSLHWAGFLGGTFINPHMHTFTVQGCPVCNQRLCLTSQKFEVEHASTSASIDRRVTTHKKTAPTVSDVTLQISPDVRSL